ncbi:MAG: LLM class flavin-dependent oxidoreductase [Proteobacteria bacterium]|nr:LLM class flavin-dependent oxidoreductase [Pseudomonadota bacterium]
MAEFGIQIEPQFGFDYSTLRDLALECEILGFNSMWLSDHLFLDARSQERNCLDCWTTLAALAAPAKLIVAAAAASAAVDLGLASLPDDPPPQAASAQLAISMLRLEARARTSGLWRNGTEFMAGPVVVGRCTGSTSAAERGACRFCGVRSRELDDSRAVRRKAAHPAGKLREIGQVGRRAL